MNRLILIGNGFDLAHGLKTDYNSFILWYLKDSFNQTQHSFKFDDDLISITVEGDFDILPIQFRTIEEFVDYFYKKGFLQLKDGTLTFGSMRVNYPNPFVITFKSRFLERVIENCNESRWVDIENEFYDELKKCYYNNEQPNISAIRELNTSLRFIAKKLETYLSTIACKKFDSRYSTILSSEIKAKDILLNSRDAFNSKLYNDEAPRSTMILNFNYTNTVDHYFEKRDDLPILDILPAVNYIHGEIKTEHNPIIFGFGDELDSDYKKMEDSRVNAFFEHIKSFGYFKTSNYHSLIRFIESDIYQVYVLGHSCGLSDRTLLNMIFENENCKSIKIFYHGDQDKNNYTTLTQEIARHFKDKVALRRKIVSFDRCESMPQIS